MEDEALRAFKSTDRSLFLNGENKNAAKLDCPLPIGFGQTISQPSLVLEMTRILAADSDCRVLEVGTGSGYQTAILAEISGQVYTVERIPALSKAAKKRLDDIGYRNIHYKTGDGSLGWKEYAPYDRIITTAAAQEVPGELIAQLKDKGRMVAPVGKRYSQDLLLIEKEGGEIKTTPLGKVVFVELKGRYGWHKA